LENLTDDAYEGGIMLGDEPEFYWIDLAPRWTPDNRLAFLRYETMRDQPEVNAISPSDRSIDYLDELPGIGGFHTYVLAVSPVGDGLAYNRWQTEDEADNGVWIQDLSADRAEQALQTIPNLVPGALEFSADGRYLLSIDGRIGLFDPDPEESGVRVIDIEARESMPVDAEHRVIAAGWSPDGSSLAYLVQNRLELETSGLYLTSTPGEPGRLVLQGDFSPTTSRFLQGITWASNNTILLSRSPETGLVLVELGEG
jgi:hypothetical protein